MKIKSCISRFIILIYGSVVTNAAYLIHNLSYILKETFVELTIYHVISLFELTWQTSIGNLCQRDIQINYKQVKNITRYIYIYIYILIYIYIIYIYIY